MHEDFSRAGKTKTVLVRGAGFGLYHLARLPTQDANNGFPQFSGRAIESIQVESDQGFCYSIELPVKVRRLGCRRGVKDVRTEPLIDTECSAGRGGMLARAVQ